MISYHDVISTERWEMRFLGFFLGICEANAYSSFRVFANDGKDMSHSTFKDTLAWTLLKHCERLNKPVEPASNEQRTLRSNSTHLLLSMRGMNGRKRNRLSCKSCFNSGFSRVRVEKCCSCSVGVPICQTCYNQHLRDIFSRERV